VKRKDYPLRERKIAKKKVALTMAFVERLKSTRLEHISIREVCESLDISEGTFYNYFPSKIDLVYYFQQLTCIRLIWWAGKNAQSNEALGYIDVLFDVASENLDNSHLWFELFSVFIGEKRKPLVISVSALERYYAFPDHEGIENIEEVTLPAHITEKVRLAVRQGEFSHDVDVEEVVMSLMTLLAGMPLAVFATMASVQDGFASLKERYRKHLQFIWEGFGRRFSGKA